MAETVPDLLDIGDEAPVSKAADSALSSAQIYATSEQEEESAQGFGSPAAASPVVNPSKHLDFDLGKMADPATPSTPVTTPLPTAPAPPATDAGDIDYNLFIKDILMWTNTVRSAFYAVTGTVLILMIDYMLGHNMPLLTVICHLTLAQMALNFMRHAVSPKMQQKATWLDSPWTAGAINKLASSIKALAAIHDKHLTADSPHKHLIIAVSLWMLSLVSCLITPTHLALVLYVSAFILPKAYMTFRTPIDRVVKDVYSKAKVQVDAADHRVKAGIIMVVILLLGCISTTDLIIAAFVICVFAHSQLPKEVEALGKKVAPVVTPLGNTAVSVGGQIGRMMHGASERFELTPTPQKKKLQ